MTATRSPLPTTRAAAFRAVAWGTTLVAGGVGMIAAVRAPGLSALGGLVPAVVALFAGMALAAAGTDVALRSRRPAAGVLLILAGVTWLVARWATPAVESSIAFSLALAAGTVYPAVLVQAVLTWPLAARGRAAALTIAAGYAIFGGLLGLARALTFDRTGTGCNLCPVDLVAVLPSVELSGAANWLGAVAGIGWCATVAVGLVALASREVGSAPRATREVAVPAAIVVGLVAVELIRRVALANRVEPLRELLVLATGVALIGVAVGAMWGRLRERGARARIAAVVADLRRSPPVGGLRQTIGAAVGDAELRIAYAVGGDRWVDAFGDPLLVGERPGRARTEIVRDGVVVAALDHRVELRETPSHLEEIVRAARLGLEHERLQAEMRVQLDDLVASRRRIVAAAAESRRRLERDLHDGAQQHLVALAVGLRLLDRHATSEDERRALAEATVEVEVALDELRAVAHGIYSPALVEEGLAAALEDLADGAHVAVDVGQMAGGRLPAAVEAVLYEIVAETVLAARAPVRVDFVRGSDRVTVEVVTAADAGELEDDLGDRVAAADGSLDVRAGPGDAVVIRAEFPCAS